ncbi:hypothetical protein B0H14DRAFT_2561653 [Mycena olivaceomarginata]|nr:hypothetical protein B0H14DRAFT_2561653 [Mycena olivaceomarginata]
MFARSHGKEERELTDLRLIKILDWRQSIFPERCIGLARFGERGHFGFRLRVSVIVHRSRGPQFGAKEKAIVREAAWKCGQRQWITDKAHNAHENRNDRETKSGGGTKALRKTSRQPFSNSNKTGSGTFKFRFGETRVELANAVAPNSELNQQVVIEEYNVGSASSEARKASRVQIAYKKWG